MKSCLGRFLRFTLSLAVLSPGLVLLPHVGAAQAVTLVPGQTKVAGTGSAGFNGDFGQAGILQLNGASAVTVDNRGNLFVTDKDNNCVRKIDSSNAESVVAGLITSGATDTCNTSANASPSPTQGLLSPAGIATDSGSNLYIADTGHNCVRELLASSSGGTASLVTVMGTCGAATLASVAPQPAGLAIDAAGNLYASIRDTTDGIYQVVRHTAGDASTSVCLVAGRPSAAVSTQCAGIANTVTLNQAGSVTFDQAGALYISDTANNCIRVLTNGTFGTAVGTCGSASSVITNPRGLVFSQAGNLFFVTSSPARYYRYMIGSGTLLQVSGLPDGTAGSYNSSQDGAAASTVPLNTPLGIAVDANNNTYVADSGNSIVRRYSFGTLFSSTAEGSSSNANLLMFQINTTSTLQVSTGPDYTIVQDTCSGMQTATSAGTVPNYCSLSVVFSPTRPGKRNSHLLVGDSVSRTSVSSGLQGLGVGSQGLLFQGVASTIASNVLNGMDSAVDSAGNVYILEQGSNGDADVREVPADGSAPTVAINAGVLKKPTALAGDAAGNWYVTDSGSNTVVRYSAYSTAQPNYITNLDTPSSIFVDGFGNALIGENGTRKDVLKVYAGGVRLTVAGGGKVTPAEGIPATTAAFQSVTAIAQAPGGTIYVGDATAHRVYAVDTAGLLHLFAGNGTSSANATGTALGEGFGDIQSLDVDAAGDVVVADGQNNKVLLITNSSSSTMNLTRIFGVQAGTAGYTGDGGLSNAATLNHPVAVKVSPNGSIVVVDAGNNAARRIDFPNFPSQPLLNFGSPAVGSTTVLTQSLFNDGNTSLLRTTDPVISNTQFHNDSASTTCGQNIASGSICNFGFSYTPTGTGLQQGTATINDNDLHSPQVVGLTANAAAAAITGFTAPAETEVYGGPYSASATITTNGGTAPVGSITFVINGGSATCTVAVNGAGTYTCTLPNGSGLGVTGSPYPVTVTFTGNYTTQTANTTDTVTPRPIVQTVNDKTKVYLAANPTLDGTTNTLATQNGSVVNGVGTDRFLIGYSTTATQTSVAGKYPITATVTPQGTTNPANYTISNTPGTLTITQTSLGGGGTGGGGGGTGGGGGGTGTGGSGTGGASPTAPAETEVYGGVYTGIVNYSTGGGVAPTGTFTFSVNGKTICSTPVNGAASTTCTMPLGSGLSVGTYTVTIAYSGDSNYAASTTTTTLTVTPAPLTVTVDSKTKVYGAANPPLTGSVSGLVNGDTITTTVTVTYATTVTAASPAGTYPNSITAAVTGTSATNYTVTTVPGNFTVTNAATTLRLTTSATPVQVGTAVTFTAVVSPVGTTAVPVGPVVFTSDGAALGTVTLDATGTATITTSSLTVGSHNIVATYAGNASFTGSTAALTEVVTLPNGSFVVTATPQTQLIRGPGTTTYNVLVTSLNGFSGPVALTCAGLPADASCAFAQATVTLTANGMATTTMTTTTTLADANASLAPHDKFFPSFGPQGGVQSHPGDLLVSAAAAFPLQLGGLGIFASGLRRRKLKGNRFHLLLLLALSVAMLGLTGCGCPSTAYHIYPITVTGTSVYGGPASSSAVVYLYVAQPTYTN